MNLLCCKGPLGALTAPLAALSFLAKRPRLWPLAIAPFLLNCLLFGVFLWWGYSRFSSWLPKSSSFGEAWWWQGLFYLVLVLVAASFLVVTAYLFSMLGRIVAAPFLEALTVKVEDELLKRQAPRMGFWRGVGRVALQESKKLLLYLVLMGLLFLFNLLPGLGSAIQAGLALLITCFFLAVDFMDYPLERRGLSLKAKLGYVAKMRLDGLAFGLSVFGVFWIPLLGLGFLPLAAVGGTLLYLEREQDRPEDARGSAGLSKPPPPPLPL